MTQNYLNSATFLPLSSPPPPFLPPLSPPRMTLDTSKAVLFIEHSERVCDSSDTRLVSARVTTKVLYASLPVSELSPPPSGQPSSPPVPSSVRVHPSLPPFSLSSTPLRTLYSGNLIRGLSAILPHPSRSMLVKGGRAFALAPSAICVRRRLPPSSPPPPRPFSRFLFLFFSTQIFLSLALSLSYSIYLSARLSLRCTDSRLARVRERR